MAPETMGPVRFARPEPRGDRLAGRAGLAWVLGIVLLAGVLRLWAPGPTTETYDEPLWLARTDRFVDALRTGEFDRATPGDGHRVTTMPGVTVMWSGAIGRLAVKAAGGAGLGAKIAGPSTESARVLRAGRAVEAGLASVVLGAFVWVASRLIGRRAAVAAGVLLATEPFLVGHGDLLHTDSLVTMFGALAIVAAMAAAWSTAPTDRRARAALLATSAAATSLAGLTKLNAIPVVAPALLAIVAIAVVDRVRSPIGGSVWRALARLAGGLAAWVAVAVGVALAAWPALWTSPIDQLHRMRASSHLTEHPNGTRLPPPLAERSFFVLRSLVVRLSPWMLVAGVIAIGVLVAALAVALVARRWPTGWPAPRVVALVLAAQVPYAVYIERQARVYDRYLLPLWPFLALAVAIFWTHALDRLPTSPALRRAAGAVAVVALSASAIAAAPYGTAYADPLVGARRTEAWLALGWGEGDEELGHTLERIEGPNCPNVVVAIRSTLRIAVRCGTLLPAYDPRAPSADYVVVEVRHVQRGTLPIYDLARREGELIQRVRIGGVTYAELWRMP